MKNSMRPAFLSVIAISLIGSVVFGLTTCMDKLRGDDKSVQIPVDGITGINTKATLKPGYNYEFKYYDNDGIECCGCRSFSEADLTIYGNEEPLECWSIPALPVSNIREAEANGDKCTITFHIADFDDNDIEHPLDNPDYNVKEAEAAAGEMISAKMVSNIRIVDVYGDDCTIVFLAEECSECNRFGWYICYDFPLEVLGYNVKEVEAANDDNRVDFKESSYNLDSSSTSGVDRSDLIAIEKITGINSEATVKEGCRIVSGYYFPYEDDGIRCHCRVFPGKDIYYSAFDGWTTSAAADITNVRIVDVYGDKCTIVFHEGDEDEDKHTAGYCCDDYPLENLNYNVKEVEAANDGIKTDLAGSGYTLNSRHTITYLYVGIVLMICGAAIGVTVVFLRARKNKQNGDGKIMKKRVGFALLLALAVIVIGIIVCGVAYYYLFLRCAEKAAMPINAHKPVIYFYPEVRTEANVKLELDGELTVTYPNYDLADGWTVTADPDGTLTDKKGRKYSYLYWEGDIDIKPDLSRGFCVKGEDTAEFLETALAELGLNDKEADDFITYWLPEMIGNKYNVITFQTKEYEDVASLTVTPKPDTVIRVNMLWYPSDKQVSIKPQDLTSLNPSERKGFTVVEWGGEKYKKRQFRLGS